jgi:hypothetical protein
MAAQASEPKTPKTGIKKPSTKKNTRQVQSLTKKIEKAREVLDTLQSKLSELKGTVDADAGKAEAVSGVCPKESKE